MNKNADKLLSSIETPNVTLKNHQSKLRKHLLSQHESQKKKGGDLPFMKKKLFRYGAIVVVSLTLVIAFGITTLLPKAPQVQAQEIVNDAMDHVFTLPVEQQKVLEERIKSDLKSSLEEAQNASDLIIVPEEEIQRVDPPAEKPEGKGVYFFKHKEKIEDDNVTEDKVVQLGAPKEGVFKPGTRIEADGKVMAPHGVKVLRYTNPEGKKVILGINEQNEPVLKMIFITKEDVKGLQKQDIRFEQAL